MNNLQSEKKRRPNKGEEGDNIFAGWQCVPKLAAASVENCYRHTARLLVMVVFASLAAH